MKPINPKDRIIFPLDLPALDEAEKFVDLLKDHVGVFKIGLELFVYSGPDAVLRIRKRAPQKPIFLDMKFHDIPETVKGAMKATASLGATFITVHCDEGSGLLKAVSEGNTKGAKVLGVTVLTSLSKQDLTDIGIDPTFKTTTELVLHRARLAKLAGCAGVVCSGLEARAVKEESGPDFLVVAPGIRSKDDAKGDQKRVTTPYEAVCNGADYIVVGRPIRNAPDPVKAAALIAEEIKEALEVRKKAVKF